MKKFTGTWTDVTMEKKEEEMWVYWNGKKHIWKN